MADGVTLNAGTGGAVINTDDITGVHTQIVKEGFGALDSLTLAASGAGAVSAGVQRVTLASDDPAVAALQILDNIVSGSEAQVDVVAALPAGNNNIGDVDVASIAAGDNNIGNVDIVTFPAEAHSADYDSGAGTDTTLAFGIAVPAAGGAAVVGGDATNGLDVDVTRVTGTVTVDGSGVTQPVSHAALTELAAAINADRLDVTLASVPSHAVTNAGTFAVQVDGAALTALQLIDNTIFVDDAAFTPATSSVTMAGFQADETATDSVDEGDAGAARMTLDRKLIVTPQPHTAGGLTIFRSLDIDETEEDVKTSAGVLYSIAAFNRTAAPLYLKFYNATAANVIVGTTTPVLTFVVPANADSDGAGFILEKTYGWTFGTAISVACTTGVADADTGAPGVNDCVIDLGYL